MRRPNRSWTNSVNFNRVYRLHWRRKRSMRLRFNEVPPATVWQRWTLSSIRDRAGSDGSCVEPSQVVVVSHAVSVLVLKLCRLIWRVIRLILLKWRKWLSFLSSHISRRRSSPVWCLWVSTYAFILSLQYFFRSFRLIQSIWTITLCASNRFMKKIYCVVLQLACFHFWISWWSSITDGSV